LRELLNRNKRIKEMHDLHVDPHAASLIPTLSFFSKELSEVLTSRKIE
jgi:hypothetical protein